MWVFFPFFFLILFQRLRERGVHDGVQLRKAAEAGSGMLGQVGWLRGQVERQRQSRSHGRDDLR